MRKTFSVEKSARNQRFRLPGDYNHSAISRFVWAIADWGNLLKYCSICNLCNTIKRRGIGKIGNAKKKKTKWKCWTRHWKKCFVVTANGRLRQDAKFDCRQRNADRKRTSLLGLALTASMNTPRLTMFQSFRVNSLNLRKLDILKNKSSLGWSGFGSITEKEQRNIRQVQHSKKTKVTWKWRRESDKSDI